MKESIRLNSRRRMTEAVTDGWVELPPIDGKRSWSLKMGPWHLHVGEGNIESQWDDYWDDEGAPFFFEVMNGSFYKSDDAESLEDAKEKAWAAIPGPSFAESKTSYRRKLVELALIEMKRAERVLECCCDDAPEEVGFHEHDEVGELYEKTPPGRERQVKALKRAKGVKNPYAVAWSSYNRGKVDETIAPEYRIAASGVREAAKIFGGVAGDYSYEGQSDTIHPALNVKDDYDLAVRVKRWLEGRGFHVSIEHDPARSWVWVVASAFSYI